jgi:prepilin-type N-terminal cleavage/methylation domain-containing protein
MQVPLRKSGRRGFSLIELLVVMAIIAILISLTTAGVMKFMVVGPRNVTRTALRSITNKVNTQWQAVRDKANREPIPTALVPQIAAWAGLPVGTGANDPRIRPAYVQLRLIQVFPQSIAEALSPPVLGPWPGYVDFLSSQGVGAGTTAAGAPEAANTYQANEMAVCLLMALQYGPQGTGVTADTFGTIGTRQLPVGSNGTLVVGLIDGWRNPILFSRSPSGQPAPPGTPMVLSSGDDQLYGISTANLGTLTVTNNTAAVDNLSSLNVP